MRSPISAHHYISQDVLDEEFKTIFGKLWLFAGLKHFLRQDRQYLTRKIGGVPIVVTRTAEGEIVAMVSVGGYCHSMWTDHCGRPRAGAVYFAGRA